MSIRKLTRQLLIAVVLLGGAASATADSLPLTGAVFVMTSSTDPTRGNEVAMYRRDRRGDLTFVGRFPTGDVERTGPELGAGPAPTSVVLGVLVPATLDPHGSQESLILSEDRRCVLVVNAGSDSITSFRILPGGLARASIVDSRGTGAATFPVSLAQSGRTVYVLNAGGVGSLVGFRLGRDCELRELPLSTRTLEGVADSFLIPAPVEVLTAPAQVSFSPDGSRLIVSVKGGDAPVEPAGLLPNGRVAVYPVTRTGRLAQPTITPFSSVESRGGPFGFTFVSRETLVITHGNSQTIGSYRLNDDNSLTLISGPFPTGALAPCWLDTRGDELIVASIGDVPLVGASPDGNGMLDVFRIRRDGTMLDLGFRTEYPDPGPGRSGNHAIDIRVIGDFLYFVQPRTGEIGRLTIRRDGSLGDLASFGGLEESPEPFAGFNPGIESFLTRCFLQDPTSRSPECLLGSAQGVVGF